MCQSFPFSGILLTLGLLTSQSLSAAELVPNEVQLPGTQPQEIVDLESPAICSNCHGGYDPDVEPVHNWRGSMMSHAGRDPIFWATLAIAEQDFDGAGDLCIRCHSTGGWIAGRSTPTDGSGLLPTDSDGVECSYCHRLTNTDDSEHQGVMKPPFIANEPAETGGVEGYYGSGMASLYDGRGAFWMGGRMSMWVNATMLGPYDDARARHQFLQSSYHRDRDFCGTCHDVSNPVTGDLAHNFGAISNQEGVVASGEPGASVDKKAAFNNPPYRYGIVERTFSEYKSAQISNTRVDDYSSLPSDLQGGVLEAAYNATFNQNTGTANYQNPPADRYFSCQTCHMRAVTGRGAWMHNVPIRTDLPLHDLTGGNYWMPQAIEYLDGQGKLRLGGNMSAAEVQAMRDGSLRAQDQLQLAASMTVEGNSLRIINHTGHKLITGYPEGRRMWPNIKWYDQQGTLIREDGAYGDLEVMINGTPRTVRSVIDLDAPNTRIYEAHMGMTQEWAAQLVGLGVSPALPLGYDRRDGSVVHTLGELAEMPPGTSLPTFHFVLNNTVYNDNRIPPFGTNAEEAHRRNAAPVSHGSEALYEVDEKGQYPYYDTIELNPPIEAVSAEIKLLYQPTSWEYIQFLNLANDGSSDFLGQEGANMQEAWLNTGMAEPFVMAEANWKPDFQINAGHSGAWFYPATAGQGQLIDIEEQSQFLFLSWFTYTDESSTNPNEQHWLTAEGNYSGTTAQLVVYETLGGQLDDPKATNTTVVGTMELIFSDCANGQASYTIESWGVAGSFPLHRAIPGTENVCLSRSGRSGPALVENDGWDGAWYDTTTPGQGFLVDVLANTAGDDFIFVAWFTYGEDSTSGQRWLTAEGPLTGATAEIPIYETTGGSFNHPKTTETTVAGSMNIEFTSCTSALVTYSLPDDDLAGSIEIERAMPGNEALCQELHGLND